MAETHHRGLRALRAMPTLSTQQWTGEMQTPLIRDSLVALAGLVLAAASQAARPLVTDDTGVLSPGSCELESTLSREKADGATVKGQSLLLGCGLVARMQVALAVDRAEEAGQRVRGTTLASKVSLAPGEEASWSASGSLLWAAVPGHGSQHAGTAVNLLHTRTLGTQFILHANLGHFRDVMSRRGSTTYGLALEHAGWGPVALMGELIGDDLAAPAWNIGLRWSAVPDALTLDIAYGQQMAGGRPKAMSLGLKLSF